MDSLLKNNRNPKSYTYDILLDVFADQENPLPLRIGKETTAAITTSPEEDYVIDVRLYETRIIRLYSNNVVYLHNGKFNRTKMCKQRMDAALQGIGKRLVSRNRVWKIYDIETGRYDEYFPGIMVTK